MSEFGPNPYLDQAAAFKRPHEPTEVKKPREKIELSPVDGLVFADTGFLTPDSGFSQTGEVPQFPRTYLRPMFIGEHGRNMVCDADMPANAVKSTVAMGKAACIEHPTRIGSTDYNFMQWKGVGENRVNERGQKKIEAKGGTISFPLGKESAMPLFVAEVDEKLLVRFMGAAYYEDLLLEEKQSELMEKYGLRMPKILTTIKFSRQFCIDNNLPIPDNDDPEDIAGQNPVEHIKANEERINDPELYKKMIGSYEAQDYKSAILGQNVRAFRNVWRVSELEDAMKEMDQEKRKEKISSILDTSRLILAKEFGEDMSDENFLKTFSKLLGRQAAILLENRINQGAMNNHKQDITLAAEVCDFDGSYQLNEDYLNDEKNQPEWVGGDEARKKEWIKEKERALYRQVLLVGAHIKPVIEALRQGEDKTPEVTTVKTFVDSIVTNLSPKTKKDLTAFLDTAENFQDIKDIAGYDLQTQENFAGYQDFFDTIVRELASELKK
ncbi:hypothetical protein KJ742_04075 [Patescibacteria group bacterium]|nr:hypothetical protein [Patescibacteria group bacterium]MBU1683098.1 hypothetical protein [Patescibacteria group bacterium]